MTVSGDLPNNGISRANIELLRWCFSKIPAGGSVDDFSFTQGELEEKHEKYTELLNCGPTNRSWKAYFNSTDSQSWKINVDTIVNAWCATVQNKYLVDVLEVTSNSKDSTLYQVVVDTNNRGEIEFNLFFDTEELLKSSPDPSESRFSVWFIEPQSGDNRDSVFGWHKVSDDEFWDEIIAQIIKNQRAPDELICQMSSHAVTENFDGVKDNIKIFGEMYGTKIKTQPQLVKNIQRADSEIDIGSVDFAVELSEDEKHHLLICECDNVGSDTLHTHLVVNGTVERPYRNSSAKDIITNSHKKVRWYNDLFDEQESSSKFIKLAVVMVSVGAIPALSSLTGILSDSASNTVPELYAALGVFALAMALVFLSYTILPLIRFRRFSWDSPKTEDLFSIISNAISENKLKILALL